jgi:hypothetical protein
MNLVELIDGPALERGVEPTSADEDEAAKPLFERRAVNQFHETH